MKRIVVDNFTILTLLNSFSLLVSGCTTSPFGADEISLGNSEISGTITLSDSAIAEGVYVWLDGFEVGTHTDDNGFFKIILAPPEAQGVPGGITGVFNLYFYMANYELAFVKVATRGGAFIYDQGEIDEEGNLAIPVEINKLLDIETVVKPSSITPLFSGTVSVDMHLQTPPHDSATVVFPTSFGRPFGTVILRSLESNELFPFGFLQGNQHRNTNIIGHVEQIIKKEFSTVQGVLPLGVYKVIPHMLINHEKIPEALLRSLGTSFEEPGVDYLNIPMRRDGGFFEVKSQ